MVDLKITALAGGVGAARFLQGLVRVVNPQKLTVIVNTADDIEFFGLHVSPDIDIVIYSLAGVLASIAGVTQVVLYRNANPAALMGTELDVIAAVVLGGAAITGGRGTVIGAVLGIFLITLLKSSLILVGIPSEWQKVAVGIGLILGASVTATRAAQRNPPVASILVE